MMAALPTKPTPVPDHFTTIPHRMEVLASRRERAVCAELSDVTPYRAFFEHTASGFVCDSPDRNEWLDYVRHEFTEGVVGLMRGTVDGWRAVREALERKHAAAELWVAEFGRRVAAHDLRRAAVQARRRGEAVDRAALAARSEWNDLDRPLDAEAVMRALRTGESERDAFAALLREREERNGGALALAEYEQALREQERRLHEAVCDPAQCELHQWTDPAYGEVLRAHGVLRHDTDDPYLGTVDFSGEPFDPHETNDGQLDLGLATAHAAATGALELLSPLADKYDRVHARLQVELATFRLLEQGRAASVLLSLARDAEALRDEDEDDRANNTPPSAARREAAVAARARYDAHVQDAVEPALRKARELWQSLNDDGHKAGRVPTRLLHDYSEGRTGDVSLKTAQAQHAIRAQELNRALQQLVDHFGAARESGTLLAYYASAMMLKLNALVMRARAFFRAREGREWEEEDQRAFVEELVATSRGAKLEVLGEAGASAFARKLAERWTVLSQRLILEGAARAYARAGRARDENYPDGAALITAALPVAALPGLQTTFEAVLQRKRWQKARRIALAARV